MTKILMIYGGWQGHSPEAISLYFAQKLRERQHQVTLSDSLTILNDYKGLKLYDLIIMNWTRGDLSDSAVQNIQRVVAEGTGLAGIHGGFTSAFQNSKQWQFLTGGLFVDHPGGDQQNYTVKILDKTHSITHDLPDFSIQSEQYYLLTDPAIHILATTDFVVLDHPNAANRLPISLPVAWTKKWGKGNIFYHSLGHDLATCQLPTVEEMTLRGFQWAIRK